MVKCSKFIECHVECNVKYKYKQKEKEMFN